MPRHTIAFFAALMFSTTARAEAALADLIFMMPKIILVGIYYELARPWVLGAIWGIAALCWAAYFVTGRDAVGDLMDWFSRPGKSLFNPTTYGAMGFIAVASLLYVLLGYAVWGAPPARHENPTYRHNATKQTTQPRVKHTLPYPYGKSPGNARGEWPTSTGSLPDQPHLAYGGGGIVLLRNPGDEGLWVRLCAAEANPCVPLRQVYLAPRSADSVERLTGGYFRLVYTQTSGKNLSGSIDKFQISNDPAHGFSLDLKDFEQKP